MYTIPKNYNILYNPNLNYNKGENNINYLPPYRSDFPSIYQGIDIELHIVDHCNLNCSSCNHFSPLAQKWFISIEDFKKELLLIQQNIPSIKRIFLLGGEPLLHPNLLDLCKITRDIFRQQNIVINVLSNGTLAHLIDKDQLQYQALNINFIFTDYFNYTDVEKIINIPNAVLHKSRILFKQTLVEPKGNLDSYNNFFNCVNHKLPCLTAKKGKLYVCPFCAHIEHYLKQNNTEILEQKDIDFLDISEIQNDLNKIQKFIFTPKNYCKYCRQDGDSYCFQPSKRDIIEYTYSLKELYFYNYSRYLTLINGGKDLINYYINQNHNEFLDYDFEQYNLNKEILRYNNAKFDIIIPYKYESIEQFIKLKDNLLQQTIINDCVIYLISDKSQMDLGVMSLFGDRTLNCIFLKNNTMSNGPGICRNIGLNNSYNNNIIFLDADDLFIVNDALELLYKQLLSANINLIKFNSYSQLKQKKQYYILKRNIIANHQFKAIPFKEDDEFYSQIAYNNLNSQIYEYNNTDNLFIEYNATSSIKNITTNLTFYDTMHFSFLSALFISIYENNIKISTNTDFTQINLSIILIYLNEILTLLKNNLHLLNNTFVRYFLYFILYVLLNINKDLTEYEEYKQLSNLIQFNNSLDINYIKKFLIAYLQKYYINNELFKDNAVIILNLIKEGTLC